MHSHKSQVQSQRCLVQSAAAALPLPPRRHLHCQLIKVAQLLKLVALPLQTWLQKFAWSERTRAAALRRRAADLPAASQHLLHQEPMFCVEAAIKSLYCPLSPMSSTRCGSSAFLGIVGCARDLLAACVVWGRRAVCLTFRLHLV